MIEAFLVLLGAGFLSVSVRLARATDRLKTAEASIQQLVSVVAMAEPEKFKLLVEAAEAPKESAALPESRGSLVDALEQTVRHIPPRDRLEALQSIVVQNQWLDQSQFNQILQYLPEVDRGDALAHYLSLTAERLG